VLRYSLTFGAVRASGLPFCSQEAGAHSAPRTRSPVRLRVKPATFPEMWYMPAMSVVHGTAGGCLVHVLTSREWYLGGYWASLLPGYRSPEGLFLTIIVNNDRKEPRKSFFTAVGSTLLTRSLGAWEAVCAGSSCP